MSNPSAEVNELSDSVILQMLQRLGTAQDMCDAASKERCLMSSMKKPQRDSVDLERLPGVEDQTRSNLINLDAVHLQQFSPRSVLADGNCMYRAVSLAFYGTEQHHLYASLDRTRDD